MTIFGRFTNRRIITGSLYTQKSIVVLPFENISSDPENEYFADGITEEIINALSKVDGLKVTARTSSFAYKNNLKDIRLIGNELGVATALEGSIRKSGSRIRISTQLIRTDNGFQVWSETFNRDLTDIFELQDEISLQIADKIRENFGHLEIQDHLVTAQTQNVEAYSHYLKGRFFQLRWKVEDFSRAILEYEKSISLDPDFLQPYFGLVQCYGLMAAWAFADRDSSLAKANAYLIEGLRINDLTSEAHFAMATKSLWVAWKPYEALKHLKKALDVNPNDSESLECAAECHIALGQFTQAREFILKALNVNPLSANHHFTLGNIHYLQKEYTEALRCFERSLQIDPTWEFSLQVSACCYVLMGEEEKLNNLLAEHPYLTDGQLFLKLYNAINRAEPMRVEPMTRPRDLYFSWSLWIPIYAGDTSGAYNHLLASIKLKKGQYLNFQREPLNEPVRLHEDYHSLAESVFDAAFEEINEGESGRSTALLTNEDLEAYKTRLELLMKEDELFTRENLSLRDLAAEMDLSANKLSWLINEGLGKNFNEYINGLRVEAFKKKALEPLFSHYSILGIAYECGFNSKSVFNDFFKKSEGMTPSAWLKKQR